MSSKLRTAALAAATVGAGVVVIALLSGLLYEQAQRARDREHFPQIGRSVDVGGRMLNIALHRRGAAHRDLGERRRLGP